MTSMKKTAKERRRDPRFALSVGLGYKVRRLPSPAKMVSLLNTIRGGKTENVSKSGMSITSSHLLLPGTILEIRVPKSPATKGGLRKARVVWVREVAPNHYQVGIRFV